MCPPFYITRFVGCVMIGPFAALHLTWAFLIWGDHATAGATPVAALLQTFNEYNVLVAVLLAVATVALVAIFMPLPTMILLMLPQQFLLLISATGAITAIYMAQYADGVIRPRFFIAADQVQIILAALCHAIAIIAMTYVALRDRRER